MTCHCTKLFTQQQQILQAYNNSETKTKKQKKIERNTTYSLFLFVNFTFMLSHLHPKQSYTVKLRKLHLR